MSTQQYVWTMTWNGEERLYQGPLIHYVIDWLNAASIGDATVGQTWTFRDPNVAEKVQIDIDYQPRHNRCVVRIGDRIEIIDRLDLAVSQP